jgi:hypothetical protein
MPILKKKSAGSAIDPNAVLRGVVVFLLLLTSLSAMMGVVNTVMTDRGLSFGGSSASLALIAFAINIAFFTKLISCSGCGTKK